MRQLELLPQGEPARASDTSLAPASPTREQPASQALAEVVPLRAGRLVKLPPRFARAAVEQFLRNFKAEGEVVEGPLGADLIGGRGLRAEEWAILLGRYEFDPKLRPFDAWRHGDRGVYVFPLYTVALDASPANWLLGALEKVKPEELDPEGRPQAWVPVQHRTTTLGREESDDDATIVEGPGGLPPLESDERACVVTNDEIRGWFAKLSQVAGFGEIPLSLARGTEDKLGFTTGRVWFRSDGVPLRVHLTTCPNSDLAEILATIVHELAHPLARARDHGERFVAAMVGIAEKAWTPGAFAEARRRRGERSRAIDYWVATSIRAALRGDAPPVARTGDDGQMARVVTKIRKLRELAANQLGLPEGINATAAANDLVTLYDLGDYQVRIDAGIHDQMVDRFVPIREGAVWRRDLAHGVARASEVFALSIVQKSRMHFFGRYADVVQAEYLFQISEARIDRECDRHLAEWKKTRGPVTAGDVKRERTSFCDSAVRAFCLKLQSIAAEADRAPRAGSASPALARAEAFAQHEHEKRGSGWRSGGTRTTRDNAAGREVGRSLEVVRGVGSGAGGTKALPGRK